MSLTSFTFTQSLVATAVISAFALTGCGGGGGSSDTGSTPASYSESASGTAAKGIIKNATVTAYELSAQGAVVRTVGASETGADGKYVLIFDSSYTGGPLKLILTAKSDGSTVMVCDVPTCGSDVAFGQDYPLPASFSLAAFAANSGSSISTQITPYSDMAAARIQAQMKQGDSLDASLIANAISEVSQLVGVNIAAVQPIDITNPDAVAKAGSDALQYAVFNAGVGAIAFANEGGFEAGIAALSESFADGQFDNSDPVSIASVVGAVGAVGEDLASMYPEIDTTALTATLAAVQGAIGEDGTYNPEPASAADQTAVAQAKALVSQVRTWGTGLAALSEPADAFALDVDTAAAVLNSDSGALAGVFGSVLSGALNTVLDASESASGLQATKYPFLVTHWGTSGPVTTNGSVEVIDNAGSLKLVVSADTNSGVDAQAEVLTNLQSSAVLGKSGGLDFASVSMTASGDATGGQASIVITNAKLDVTYKSGTFATSGDIGSLVFTGGLTMQANGVTFNGNAELSVVSNSVTNAAAPFSLEEIALSGTFTGPKGSANASASLQINNAATFDTFGLIDHEPVLWASNQLPDDAWGISAAYSGGTLQYASYDPWLNQTCFGGTANSACEPGDTFGLAAKAEAALKADYPTALNTQNVYAFYHAMYGTGYSATLTFGDFETASNFAKATLTVSAGVVLTGYPAANLSATAKRTAYSATAPVVGNVVAVLSYNGQSFTVTASNEAENGTTPTLLTISNPDGVKLTVFDSMESSVTVNGATVGTVSSSSGITLIRYADGTFESLN